MDGDMSEMSNWIRDEQNNEVHRTDLINGNQAQAIQEAIKGDREKIAGFITERMSHIYRNDPDWLELNEVLNFIGAAVIGEKP